MSATGYRDKDREGDTEHNPVPLLLMLCIAGPGMLLAQWILMSLLPLHPVLLGFIGLVLILPVSLPLSRLQALQPRSRAFPEGDREKEARRESEKKFHILTESFPDVFWILDTQNLKFLYISPSVRKLRGYAPEEVLSSPFDASLPPDAFESALRTIRSRVSDFLSAKEPADRFYSDQIRQPRKDGSLVWTEVVTRFWLNEQNGHVEIYGVTHDLTERKRIEKALRESNELFTPFLRHSPIFAFIKEVTPTESRILLASDNYREMVGIPDPQMIGKTMEELFPPDFARKITADDWAVVTGRKVLSLDEDLNGRNFTTIKFPIIQGERSLLAGYTIDITERKQAEEALRKSRILLQSSLESIQGAYISSIDKDYNYFYFNTAHKRRMKEFYGTDIEIGMNLLDCITRDDDKLSTKKNYDRALSGESHTITKGYNAPIPCFENTFNPIRNEKNEVIGATGFALDITDRIIAENERRRSEEYLLQVQRLESLGVLAGGIAHDFNNILTGVFGFIDLARIQAQDPVVSDYLSRAIESMERAKGLTRQLLTFSKGGAPIRKPTAVAVLVKETSQFSLSGSNVKCSLILPGDLWTCNVDRNQIGQVIQNLMINAVQSMPMGGVIEVRAANVTLGGKEHPTLAKGDYVRISVRDQGTGISKEMLPRIFDPFFTTKTKGHGLGLAISYSIVSRHDGAINVDSEQGKGSVFHVYLPACGEPFVENGGKLPARHSGSGRFLVMDDEKAVRTLLTQMLQSFGYTVVCKENGKETMDFLLAESGKADPIRAMILDLTIPGGIGGRELAAEIRKTDGEIPLFVASGYADDPVMASPRDYGLTASIAKPFVLAELVQLLETHLAKE